MARFRKRLYSWAETRRILESGVVPYRGLTPVFESTPLELSDVAPAGLAWCVPCRTLHRYLSLLGERASAVAADGFAAALRDPVCVWRTSERSRVGLLLDVVSREGSPLAAYVALDGVAQMPSGPLPCVFLVGVKELDDLDATLTWAIRNGRVDRVDRARLRALLEDCDLPAPLALTALPPLRPRAARRAS